MRRNDGSTSRAAAFVGAAGLGGVVARVGIAWCGGGGLCGLDGGVVGVALGVGSRVARTGAGALCAGAATGAEARTGAGGASRGEGVGAGGLDGGVVCIAIGVESRTAGAGTGVLCGAAGAGAETEAALRAVESATVGVELAVSVFEVESVGVGELFAATRLVVPVLTRVRRAGAGLGDSEFSDSASGDGLAAVFVEGARRRTGAEIGGVASAALSPVGATIGLRLRGAFGRSASSMRRSLAASEHGEPCARLC